MDVYNFYNFEELQKSGFLEKLVLLYCEIFKEWDEIHVPEYVVTRLEYELMSAKQYPFLTIVVQSGEVLGGCWGAVLPKKNLKERLLRWKTSYSDSSPLEKEVDQVIKKLSLIGSICGMRFLYPVGKGVKD